MELSAVFVRNIFLGAREISEKVLKGHEISLDKPSPLVLLLIQMGLTLLSNPEKEIVTFPYKRDISVS